MRRYGGIEHEARKAGKGTRCRCEANRCEGECVRWEEIYP